MTTTVLCVEDESEILEYLGVIVETAGFQPILCSSAEEALEKCKLLKEEPLAVVSDYAMPSMNGLTLRAKLYSKYPNVPFCILSGHTTPDMLQRGIDLRIAKFLHKPFSRADLIEFLQAAKNGNFAFVESESEAPAAATPAAPTAATPAATSGRIPEKNPFTEIFEGIEANLTDAQEFTNAKPPSAPFQALEAQLQRVCEVATQSKLPNVHYTALQAVKAMLNISARVHANRSQSCDVYSAAVKVVNLVKQTVWFEKPHEPNAGDREKIEGYLQAIEQQLEQAFLANRENSNQKQPALKTHLESMETSKMTTGQIPPSTTAQLGTPLDAHQDEKDDTKSASLKEKKQENISSIVKVDARLLDEFMESAGELTVVRNIVNKLIRDLERKYPNCESVSLLFELLDDMHKLTSEVQTKIHELRLVNIGEICKTYPRVVRDLGKKLQKDLVFSVQGEDVLVDNGHAKVLAECLIHLIRNSADHGLETPAERIEAGKQPKGNVRVSALRQDSSVVVEVNDDGRGINTAKVGKKALERGLLDDATLASMSTQQVNELIFKPGFSTADEVTDISGRGVGMDMVFNSIKSLGGETELIAQQGKGTTFRLKLPDPGKANIIEALLIQAGGEHFAVPQSQVVRAYEVSSQHQDRYFRNAGGVTLFLNKANQLMPIVSLALLLSLPIEQSDVKTYLELDSGTHQYCLQVDCILDTEEIVTRKLKTLKDKLAIFLGVTFVGVDGLCLILDTEKLAEFAGVCALSQHNIPAKSPHLQSLSQAGHSSNEHLLVAALGGKTVALNLHDIDRLERIPKTQVQKNFSGSVVLYHGKTTSLSHMNQILERDACEKYTDGAPEHFAEVAETQAATAKHEIDVVAFHSPRGWVLVEIEEIIDAFYPEDIQFIADGSGFAVAGERSYPIVPLLQMLKKQQIIESPEPTHVAPLTADTQTAVSAVSASSAPLAMEQPAAVTATVVESDGIFWVS